MRDIGRRTVVGAIPASFLGGLFDRASVGKPAQNFNLTTFDRTKVTLADLAGKVVVLNFWATWCAPCRVELPTLDTYVRQHPDADLKLFAIDTDDQVSELKLRQLSGMVAFPLAMRFSGNAYGPIGGEVPTNYVIDRAGVVRYAQPGAFTAAAFDAVVAPLLAASPPIGRPAASST